MLAIRSLWQFILRASLLPAKQPVYAGFDGGPTWHATHSVKSTKKSSFSQSPELELSASVWFYFLETKKESCFRKILFLFFK